MEKIEITGFRNLAPLRWLPHAKFNIISGENAAGKTSLLEAIYFLARARSFRTHRLDRLIQWGEEVCQVFALRNGQGLGAARQRQRTQLRYNGETLRNRAMLATQLPVQLINTEHQRLLLDGPQVRRQFLDWGAFHLNTDYRRLASGYAEALRQRNAALRSGDRRQETAWTQILARYAEGIDRERRAFVDALRPNWQKLAEHWLNNDRLGLHYAGGAPEDGDWLRLLTSRRESDRECGYTRQGPHRADLRLTYGKELASEALSRGQQKLLIVAMLLAEVRLWAERGLQPLLLIDDLSAELDADRLAGVLDTLQRTPVQTFITAIEAAPLVACCSTSEHLKLQAGRALAMVQ
ncbi:hypothetical protein CKO15_00055 [Halorhodospira abdelmalekii]|uniref:DNA replication/repair protein RecF n=1 Tax=Halorhodospira abdelmalekii TaxID=421629 RepID=UPI001903F3A3|nr:DNA replication and repair protein RecF [Halorhodospira abdelmalekii]MBK1733699.1 hypothetical protein [Halorhodospira abdelmalekii]